MKTATIILAVLIGFVGGLVVPAVQADWTPGENQRFFEHVARVAEALHNAKVWGKKLSDIAVDENIGAPDPNFVDVAPWTKTEVLALKSVLDDFEVFMDGSATLSATNRAAAVNAMLLGLQ